MLKKGLLIIIFFVLFSCKSSFTKIGDKNANYIPYYLKVYEADSLYLEGRTKDSYVILNNLFNKYEPINMDIYEEYYTFLKLKKELKYKINKKELALLVTKYGYKSESVINLLVENEKNTFKNKVYPKLRDKYLSNINLILRDSIFVMKKRDQLYRGQNFNENIEKQKEIDDINFNKIKDVFIKYGYPDKDLIGSPLLEIRVENGIKKIYNLDILTILLHTTKEQRKNFVLPTLKKFLISGETNPIVYGYVFDQSLLYDLKDQYFGTYANAIEDELLLFINKNRLDIGLPKYGYEKWRSEKLKTLN